jgi:adenylate cyclase
LSIDALSSRRRELLQLVAKGLTNDEIGRVLSISPGTVRSHISTLLEQLDVSNRTEAAALYVAWESRPNQVAEVLSRPAIAVLPFESSSTDPRSQTVALGLFHDFAHMFARWCWFPVIATMSSKHGRSLGRTSQEIGAALNARFLVDGALRPRGSGWRLSVQLVDATTGFQLWSDQRDYSSEEPFGNESEVCHAIVAAAYSALTTATLFAQDLPGAEHRAWELAYQGMALRERRDAASNEAAGERFQAALAREPQLPLAHFGLGLLAYDAVLNQWGSRDQAIERLCIAGERCRELAPQAAEGHFLVGRYLQARADWGAARGPLETAVGLNPSFALAHAALAQSLEIEGRTDDALLRLEHAARLGPRSFLTGLAVLRFTRAEYIEALALAERAITLSPMYPFARALAATSAALGGHLERAVEHIAVLRTAHPYFNERDFVSTFGGSIDVIRRFSRGIELASRGWQTRASEALSDDRQMARDELDT